MKKDVIENEKRLNELTDLFNELNEVLDKLEAKTEDLNKLKEYYISEEYMNDVDISNETDEYDDIECGVLSEDLAYDLLGDSHQTSIRMLEIATKMIKEY